MSFGALIPGRQETHTRENTIDDLEIIVDTREVDVSIPRQFSKLEGDSYIRLGVTPVPEEDHVSPPRNGHHDNNGNNYPSYTIPGNNNNNNNNNNESPLLNKHSYHKYHQTYESNDIAYTYANTTAGNNSSSSTSTNGGHIHSSSKQPSALSIDTVNFSQLLFDWAPKATIFSSIVNLCNSIVGAAILGLPFATAQVGWLTSIILLTICCIISQFTFQLQTSSGIIYNNSTQSLSSSYYNLSQATIPCLKIISDIVIASSCLGAITAYLIIIGDLLPDVVIHVYGESQSEKIEPILKNRRFWISMYMIILILPTAIPRKLDGLRYTSSLAIICFGLITVTMAIYVFDDDINQCNDNDSCGIKPFADFTSTDDILAFFKAIPIYLFGFGSHPLGFAMTNELLNSTFSRMNIVTTVAFTLTAILYIIVSLLGYFTFGEDVESNILLNYPPDDLLVSIARVGLSIAVAFSYPVVMTPGRHCISTTLFGKNASQISNIRFYIITFGIICVTFTVAMIVDDLGVVLGIIGSTSAPMSILILPGLYYYMIEKKMDSLPINQRSRCCSLVNTYGSLMSLIIGIILIPFCVVILFLPE